MVEAVFKTIIMAEFRLNDQMKVKNLQASFKKKYGATLRVYKGMHFADPKSFLKDLSDTAHPTGYLSVNSKITVEEFEKKFFDAFGVKVQVAKPDNSDLAENNMTVHAVGRIK